MKTMKNKSFPIVIGKVQISPVIEETGYACLSHLGLKSGMMGAVLGKSGSGKTYALASMVFSTFANSAIGGRNQKITVWDPHCSSVPRIVGLIGEFYAFDPKHTRHSSVLSYSHPGSGNFGYDPKTGSVRKPFFFNPMVPFSDGKGGYVHAELRAEWFSASLQGTFAITDFGPRNLLAVGTVSRMFLSFNAAIIEGKITGRPFFTLKDFADFFLRMSNTRAFPDYVNAYLPSICPKVSAAIRPSLRKMVRNVKTDKSYFDSANTKLGTFLLPSTDEVFGAGIGPENADLLYDMSASLLDPQTETCLETFDLSKFGEEKSVIMSCATNAAYYFGKKRPLPALAEFLLVIDEFQSFNSIRSSTIYFSVQNILRQLRKYGVGIIPVFQELTDEVKSLFSNFSFVFVFALRQDAAEKVISDLNAGVSGNFELLPEHVSNLRQGRFFARFDTKKHGVLTAVVKSMDFSNPSEVKALLSLSRIYS